MHAVYHPGREVLVKIDAGDPWIQAVCVGVGIRVRFPSGIELIPLRIKVAESRSRRSRMTVARRKR